MAVNAKGLGRGLGALFQDDAEIAGKEQNAQTLPIGSLLPNPDQPRREFDQAALEGLSESIKSQGLLQPILVRPIGGSKPPRYEIVAGERRWRAAKLAGIAEVPVTIKDLSDKDTLAIALIENLQREDLNALEEALGISRLKEEFGLSQEDLAKNLGKSRSAIANSLRLLNLSEAAKDALRDGKISAGHARALLSLPDAGEQAALLASIIAGFLSVREAEGWAARQKGETDGQNTKGLDDNNLNLMPKRPTKLPQSALLLDLQEKAAGSIKLPVKFSGKEDKGRMSISYSSKEELHALLQIIGVQADF